MPVFDSDIPDKSERGGSSPGGFTGGGGGGGISGIAGGGGGFGGFGPGGFGGHGLAPMTQRRKPYYSQGGGPAATATSPGGYAYGGSVMPSDTVDAKLTPGEFVVNRTAASDPDNARELEEMNAQGLQQGGYDDAMQPGAMGMGGSPGLSREALVELLQVLLSGQQEGNGLGGWVGKHAGLLTALGSIALPMAAPGLKALSAAHPLLSKAIPAAYEAKQGMDAQREQSDAEQRQRDAEADAGYLNARERSERGYAFGGQVGQPAWSQGMYRFTGGKFANSPTSNAAPPPGAPAAWTQQYKAPDPSVLAGMQEAGAADANNFASGVMRQAQLEGADPGAQAAYRIRALASAGRGAADRLSAYRTDFAAKDLDYRRGLEKSNADKAFEFQKQQNDFYNQQYLKRIK